MRWTVVEEQHVCLYSVGVEDAGGQSQDGVELRGLHQFLSDCFPSAAFKQDVIRDDYSGAACRFQHGANVLNEVDLLEPISQVLKEFFMYILCLRKYFRSFSAFIVYTWYR